GELSGKGVFINYSAGNPALQDGEGWRLQQQPPEWRQAFHLPGRQAPPFGAGR
ncbi:MAG: hypothetical protein RLZZ226_62, partial [Pseudomonadota bacterium]